MSKRVWLFSRLSTFTDADGLKRVMDNCRNKALEKGYTVVDETVVIGSSELAKAALKDIVEHNDIEKGAESIFAINGNVLSQDLKTAQEIYEYITDLGMPFETSYDDVVLLDKNNPIGATFNLLATGQKEIPENFPFNDEDGFELDEYDTSENMNIQSM